MGGGDEIEACRELGDVNSTFQTNWKNRTRILRSVDRTS